jgi:PhnB protein
MKVMPYLYFKGGCEPALSFYADCGLGKITALNRYAGTPMAERDGGAWRDKVLHSEFEGPGVQFCASDGADSEPMKGCAMFIEHDDPAAAGALFERLSAGGTVHVPWKQQFWGAIYGNFTDQFGVQWAINCTPKR